MPSTIELHVGRLCEIRTWGEVTFADVTNFRARLADVLTRVPSRVVICSNLSDCGTYPVEVVDALVSVAKVDNPKIERHAMIAPSTSRLALQLVGIINSTDHRGRRFCPGIDAARGWLEPVLDAAELARLDAFLAAPTPA